MTREQRILSLASIVHGAAKRYHGDRDDNTQAAWIGAIRAVDTWDGRAPLNGYAWQCCNWYIRKHIRDQAPKTGRGFQQKYYTLRFGDKPTLVELEDTHARPDPSIENAPDRIDAQRLLDRLTPRDRSIVTLLSEYSQHEVARAIGCGQATIGRVVKRVRMAA